jgi:hypothetical protein
MWAMKTYASADAMVRSKSLASLRHLPSQANVLSTTHLRGSTSKPLMASVRLMISSVNLPTSALPLQLRSCMVAPAGMRQHVTHEAQAESDSRLRQMS